MGRSYLLRWVVSLSKLEGSQIKPSLGLTRHVTLTIAENFRGLFYIPFYVLRELSLDQAEGISVQWLPPGSPGGAIDAVKAGRIDLTWGGPMRVMIDHDSSADDPQRLLSVSQAVGRDPFCLLASKPGVTLKDLTNLRVSVVKEVPTPWLCLQADLADLGVALPKQLRTDLDMHAQLHALAVGEVDVIQAFEPFVSQALRTGKAYLVYEASSRGPTVYTAFITSRNTLERRKPDIRALDRALGRALTWMRAEGPAATMARVRGYFPDLSEDDLSDSVSRYIHNEVWSDTTRVDRAGFDRLSDSFFRGGAIRAPAHYEHCVFNFGDHSND
jgi:NitT/TauT family transport system substrate-binding protein